MSDVFPSSNTEDHNTDDNLEQYEHLTRLISTPPHFTKTQYCELLRRVSSDIESTKSKITEKWKSKQKHFSNNRLFTSDDNSLRASAGISVELSKKIDLKKLVAKHTKAINQEQIHSGEEAGVSHSGSFNIQDHHLRAAARNDLKLLVSKPNTTRPTQKGSARPRQSNRPSNQQSQSALTTTDQTPSPPLLSTPASLSRSVDLGKSLAVISDSPNEFKPAFTIYPNDKVPITLPLPSCQMPPLPTMNNTDRSLLPTKLPADFALYSHSNRDDSRNPEDVQAVDPRDEGDETELTTVTQLDSKSILNQAAQQSFALPHPNSVKRIAHNILPSTRDGGSINDELLGYLESHVEKDDMLIDDVYGCSRDGEERSTRSKSPLNNTSKIFSGTPTTPVNLSMLSFDQQSVELSKELDELSQRFQDVMQVLQMPLLQKIDLLIKYTSMEFVELFKSAITAWEMASVAIAQRERLLSEKQATVSSLKHDSQHQLNMIEERLNHSTQQVESILVRIFLEFGDVVTYNGESYFDLADINIEEAIGRFKKNS
ncbi:hypothetical protein P9112_012544 [Eukaryota sp. TZLM1-RC]